MRECGILSDRVRDAATIYNFADYDAIIFVSLELPGGRPVSERNSRLSQPETISKFETSGDGGPEPSTAWVLGEEARGQPQYRRIRKSCASRRRMACLRNSRSDRAQSSFGRPNQRAFLQDQISRSHLLPG